MKSLLVSVSLFGSAVFALDLTFASVASCTGKALHGRRDLPSISCYNLTSYPATQSVILASFEPGETVKFFSDAECQDEIYRASSDQCYTETNRKVLGFSLQAANDATSSSASSTDVAVYEVKLTNFTGLSQSSPFNIDLNFSRFATGVTLSIVAGLVAISTIATGCVLNDSTDVLSIYGCIAGPMSTIIAVVGGYLISKGVGSGPGPLEAAINMGTGTISDLRRRELIDSANFEYMSGIMKRDRGDGIVVGEHVGFQGRDMGNGVQQRSPLYEMDFGVGGMYHMAAFFDERSNKFVHHLHRAEESGLKVRHDGLGRRQISYDDVRWNTNGLDFDYCIFQGATSGFSAAPTDLWQTAFDQFKCQVPEGSTSLESDATNVNVNLFNEAATLVGSITIVGYSGTDTSSGSPPTCANPTSNLNEDCVVA
ncbi:hypothetical protein ONS95_008961 [Cadophora gregata]|uniref:uncharacterized protein n=1 Tax=Cadophora gregata TaxID=51156 RepID=UPI0026DD78D0|nr:uncharacterized protein ONS95_008961 [Cadophora gregata]KAK0123973.1 hypothetical protein ONS95_008961 [Cadophora gregata]KAK0130313.1 hypothetical protein ONS96_000834 [Cadophora gregata f. sp. sojae]